MIQRLLSLRPFPRTFTTTRRQWSSFALGDSSLQIDALNTSFPYIWLRDSCQSPTCVHPSTSQKLHQSSDIPFDIKAISAKLFTGTGKEEGISVEWSDGHSSTFTRSFLERHASPQNLRAFHGDVPKPTVYWDRAQIEKEKDLFTGYDDLKTPEGLLQAIDQLCAFGLVFIRNVPNSPTSHEACHLRSLASLLTGGDYDPATNASGNDGIRHTFYGSLWDVQNRNSENIAYTNLRLWFHMDLLYFSNPPRYQILHCLRNRVSGGSSVFADTFSASRSLASTHPEHFRVLTKTPIPFQYVHNGRHYYNTHPTIQLDPSGTGEIEYVNWSPPFQAPLLLAQEKEMEELYAALKAFDTTLNEEHRQFEYLLKEGDAVVFDNRRVVHARTAFSGGAGEGEGVSRWLKGCYFEGDRMWDLGRRLRLNR